MKKEEAIELAASKELDLVLISPNSNPPVVKLVSWEKFKYERIKKLKKSIANSKSAEQKEWWIKPNIGERDLEIKINKIKKFLTNESGIAKIIIKSLTKKNKIKTTNEDIQNLLNKFIKMTEDFATIVGNIQKDGKNYIIILKNKK